MLRQRTDGHVLWLTFARPEKLNAFKVSDQRDLRMALEEGVADPETRVVVLAAEGRAFSAGADRSLLDGSAPPEERDGAAEEFTRLISVLRDCEKPLLAAVNGLAVGIGCTMLLYCDFVVAGESARFRLPFTTLGLAPEAGSSFLLPARARWDEAMWAMLSSEWIESGPAREMGLAWRVVADSVLLEETGRVAAALAALPPESVMATKRVMTAGRADAARAAFEREMVEMGRLGELRRPS
jgi:enoyl-CoA hydratase/carnithine racemase